MANNQSQGTSGSKWLYTLGAIAGLIIILGGINAVFSRPGNQQTAANTSKAASYSNPELGHLKLGADASLIKGQYGQANLAILNLRIDGSNKANAHLQNFTFDLEGDVSLASIKNVSLWDGSTQLASIFQPNLSRVVLGASGLKVPAGTSKVLTLKVDLWPAPPGTNSQTYLAAGTADVYATDKFNNRILASGIPVAGPLVILAH